MRKFPLAKLLLISPLLLALPLRAAEMKFTAPADVTRSLEAVVAPTTLSVVNEEGGFLRFRSGDKMRFCQMGVLAGGTTFKQADGEIDATFRFGAEKQSFGLYLRVSGSDAPAYLVLASTWVNGQGVIRLFKVPPRVQVEDQHQIAKESVHSPLTPGSWYTLKVRTAAQNGQAVQLTAELVPLTAGAASTTVTAVDPSGSKEPGAVQVRFYTPEDDQNIDLKVITTLPAAPAGKAAATPAKR